MHQAETFKGILAANAAVSVYAWAVNNISLSAVFTVLSLSTAVIGWLVMRKEKQAEAARNKRTEDAIAALNINVLEIAIMAERILHPEAKPKSEVK